MNLQTLRQEREPRPILATPRPIPIARLQTTVSTVATARDDADFRIDSLVAAAATGSGDTVTLYLVESGGTAGAEHLLLYQNAVGANNRQVLFTKEYPLLVPPGYTLQALCGTNNAVHVYGMGFDYRGDYAL